MSLTTTYSEKVIQIFSITLASIWFAIAFIIVAAPIMILLRYSNKPDPIVRKEYPSVAILRPLKGLDDDLEINLVSTFQFTYPNYHVIFSLKDQDDPAYDLVMSLILKYPQVKCQVIIGIENVGVNPKVNNLVKGYNSCTSDIIWILDSNVRMEPGSLGRAVDCLMDPTKNVGLVHHVPCGVNLSSMGSYLDGVFMASTHARMYTFINSAGIASCLIGKSNLFRKADLDSLGGLAQFGKYLSEDNMIGVYLMSMGLSHQIAPDFAYQSMGPVTIPDFLQRRFRWIRVRKFTVTAATLFEPFTECLVLGFLSSFAMQHLFGISKTNFLIFHWLLWLISDLTVSTVSYFSRSGNIDYGDVGFFIIAWFIREIIAFPVYMFAMAGQSITWRDQNYYLYADGTVELVNKKLH
ncbi:glycosyl transferase family 21-domain-containing protein [Globomyces pollinis-pini]|nr:glycosyl transferase family 21-domain-containing protein [Globomyces pollinis-pini]